MRRSSFLACGFVGVLSVSAALLSTQAAESRTQRTLNRAELYEVLGGFIGDYCCADPGNCYNRSSSCTSDFFDQETCDAALEYIVVIGNTKTCSAYTPGATCTNTGNYACTSAWTCTWNAAMQVCDTNTLSYTAYAPQTCSDNGPPKCP